jgi:predicted dehydrogenase
VSGGHATPLRIGIVGCGAVAELNHLPALTRLGLHAAALADRDEARAKNLAKQFGAPIWSSDFKSLLPSIDVAIVATPPSTHAEIATFLLSNGIHVLVEKPMGANLADCKRMIAAATAGHAALTVVHMRRYGHAVNWITELLASGFVNGARSFDIREGFIYGWPAVSDYAVRRETGVGGVLLDLGPHVLDLALSWFGDGDPVLYADDYFGGVEADCELRLRMKSGVVGEIELSRTRNLQNRALIRGSDWLVEIPNLYLNVVKTEPRSLARKTFEGLRGDRLPPQDVVDLFVRQLSDWFKALREPADPLTNSRGAARGIALIEECYRIRQPLDLPWVSFDVREVASGDRYD